MSAQPTTRAGRAARSAQVAAEGLQRTCGACGGGGHRANSKACPKHPDHVEAATEPAKVQPLAHRRVSLVELRRQVCDELVSACWRRGIIARERRAAYAFAYLRNIVVNYSTTYSSAQLAAIAQGLQDGIETTTPGPIETSDR